MTQAQTDKMIFDFEGIFDLEKVAVQNAEVSLTSGASGQALEVLLKKNGAPSVEIKSKEWGLSRYLGLSMDIENCGAARIEIVAQASIGKQKTSLNSFVRVEPGESETLFIVFRRGDVPDYIEKRLTGMKGLPGGHVWHWLTPDPDKLNTLRLYTTASDKDRRFRVDNIRGTGQYKLPTEAELNSGFFPFVDKFGQYRHTQWPGKTTSEKDLKIQHERELKSLAAHPGPENWNQYGGWADGPMLKATGHFRTQKVDGKWWLVDPEGRLFWSQGITGVRLSQKTKIKGRRNYFDEPCDDGDFRQANLKRKLGDNWSAKATDLTHTRLRSWAINTMACWSDQEIYKQHKTPYTVYLASGVAKEMPSEMDEETFRQTVRRRITAGRVAGFKDDPWCVGVFVDNELRWPRKNMGPVAETYYKVVKEVLKSLAPDILYLGSRIHGAGGYVPAYMAAAKYCDVVSINRYEFIVLDEDLPQGSRDKPMIIGEFHFGALDRGLLHTGLRGVPNQEQRAHAYTFYVQQALRNNRIVGAHWFQYTDQLVSGRGDGENYQIGFVDIADRPYPEIIEDSREIGKSLYEYRINAINVQH